MRRLLLALLVVIIVISVIGYVLFREDYSYYETFSPDDGTLALVPIIDPGHGEFDPGTRSADGLLEKDVNLEIGLRTDMFMRFLGLNTILTRDGDGVLDDPDAGSIRQRKVTDTKNRVRLVNETEGGVLISIHQNYFEQSNARGSQVFFRGEENKQFANTMQNALYSTLNFETNRSSKPISGIYLLDHSEKPSVLIECGFLSNPEEVALLGTSDYQLKFAMAITKGFLEWSSGQ